MDAAVNTRKAYNTDVWIALVVKFFRDWDFPHSFNDIASELVRLEALRRLSTDSGSAPVPTLPAYDPLREALCALTSALRNEPPKASRALQVEGHNEGAEQPLRMSLRGSFTANAPGAHLDNVCINSSDKAIVHYLFSRFGERFGVEFWNHFFSIDSLGRIFREQEASGNSKATLARKMASLQRLEEFLHRSQLLTKPNLFMQRRPRINPSAQIVLEGNELKQIESHLDRAASSKAFVQLERDPALIVRDRAMIAILDQYLIRANALCSLTIRDIDLRRKTKTMFVVEKGRKQQVYTLMGGALRCLKDYLNVRQEFLDRHPPATGQEHFLFHTIAGKPMNTRSLSRIIDGRASEAGIKVQVGGRSTIGAHVIRRSGGARYIEAGARIEAVSQLMNHSQIETTWGYV